MARAMTPETEIRHLKREIKRLELRRRSMSQDAEFFRRQSEAFSREAAEWRRRFDALLLKLPDVPKETP